MAFHIAHFYIATSTVEYKIISMLSGHEFFD